MFTMQKRLHRFDENILKCSLRSEHAHFEAFFHKFNK